MLALVYDVHGNLRALEAVLEDARAAGANRFLLGGDYAAFGPEPVDTLALLRSLPDAVWIRGNWERWCANPGQALGNPVVQGALDAAVGALDPSDVEELGALPEQIVLDGVRYCHGSPKSDVESWLPAAADTDAELLAGAGEPRVVFGHMHLQFRRTLPGGVELVNPGSTGQPFDGDTRAAYALVDSAGELEMRRVAYDVEAAAAALLKRYAGAEWAAVTAKRLRTAQF